MSPKYPLLSSDDIVKVLRKLGFEKVSQKGSHAKFKRQGVPIKIVILPMHDEVARGTLKSILEQAAITLEEFLKYL